MSLNRREVLLGLGGVALTGCATPGSAIYEAIDAYRALDRARNQYQFTHEQIDGQPLGVLGLQVEGGLKGIVVWDKREGDYDCWRSGNGVVVVTQAGRLIRTSAFPQDQLASRVAAGTEFLGTPLDPSRQYEVSRELDFAPDQYGVEAIYQLRYVRSVTIAMMDRSQRVDEWAETVRLPKRRRQWKQLFQVVPTTGEVVRSVQHVGPKMRVTLEVLKAAAA